MHFTIQIDTDQVQILKAPRQTTARCEPRGFEGDSGGQVGVADMSNEYLPGPGT